MTLKAVILVGGPSRGTRFRPLSLDVPKPLFPVAGEAVIYHHLSALSQLPDLKEVLLIGFFEDNVFAPFLQRAATQFPNLNIQYLREYQSLGTAGGIYHFRDKILEGEPQQFFVLHVDIACPFPLTDMIQAHMKHRGICTMLGTKVSREQATKYGCLVANPDNNEVLHYVEKPDAFISDLISCGVYLFDRSVMNELQKAKARKDSHQDDTDVVASSDQRLRLEQDVLRPLSQDHKLYVHVTERPWRQIKTAGSAVGANAVYLEHLAKTSPEKLYKSSEGGPEIDGAVFIDPSAKIDPTAKIGPNVSIGPRVQIGKGVRIKDAIILDGVQIGMGSCILHSVVGWNSKVGAWARVEGSPIADPNIAMMENGVKSQSITILGKEVSVKDEIIIRNCIVLPHKELKYSYHSEILM
ncbi:nucleotide-diphospho-sugar transferase [Hesseltinella vesiculosa]|uniref:mannose-1-phosphate guanylyltransferase n=1 Tax=Hesseltinella vesiculosa TaxID=101127 RepID=A0A1X2GVW2_9FUNG|nr:nucleotide-diphospho-sugar transferase [Hesseltinella vesiculosa]